MIITDQINEVRRKSQISPRPLRVRWAGELNLDRSNALLLIALALSIAGAVSAYSNQSAQALWLLGAALVLVAMFILWRFFSLLASDRTAEFSRLFTESAAAEMPLVHELLSFDEGALRYVHQEYVDRISIIEGATALVAGPLRTAGLLGVLAATTAALFTIMKAIDSQPWWINIFWGLPVGFVFAGVLIDDTLNGLRRRRDLLNRAATLRSRLPSTP